MGEAYFYHLTRQPLEVTAATLLGKALGAGWRVALRGRDAERLKALDAKLWHGARDSFLPHGLAGGDHDARQPILLTADMTAANDPQCVMAVDGAEVTPEEVGSLSRVMILFDGTDGEAVAHARTQWKSLTDAGAAARYWSEESGRWEEKASKNTG
ncbi:DNA polymerase III subunit chi [Thalassobacter stenotrophicus]|uniref:DNA polymerase III subunit chi n=1 Tax=Thalassobacter stenotrophicus TaxID=266809 RepID=UPI0022A9E90D|nr:DNA polymerase III subunit chi [Thalassobacter stenotrophicus]UYP69427.1 DNA polymerase III subunit chi [Thalassobacter stenotrophicus]